MQHALMGPLSPHRQPMGMMPPRQGHYGGCGAQGARHSAVAPPPHHQHPQQHPHLQTWRHQQQGAPRPQPQLPAPCAHNNWDNVRVKKGIMMLRCRRCQQTWKCPASVALDEKCPDFLKDTCNGPCNKIHINMRKESLMHRYNHFGNSVLDKVPNHEWDRQRAEHERKVSEGLAQRMTGLHDPALAEPGRGQQATGHGRVKSHLQHPHHHLLGQLQQSGTRGGQSGQNQIIVLDQGGQHHLHGQVVQLVLPPSQQGGGGSGGQGVLQSGQGQQIVLLESSSSPSAPPNTTQYIFSDQPGPEFVFMDPPLPGGLQGDAAQYYLNSQRSPPLQSHQHPVYQYVHSQADGLLQGFDPDPLYQPLPRDPGYWPQQDLVVEHQNGALPMSDLVPADGPPSPPDAGVGHAPEHGSLPRQHSPTQLPGGGQPQQQQYAQHPQEQQQQQQQQRQQQQQQQQQQPQPQQQQQQHQQPRRGPAQQGQGPPQQNVPQQGPQQQAHGQQQEGGSIWGTPWPFAVLPSFVDSSGPDGSPGASHTTTPKGRAAAAAAAAMAAAGSAVHPQLHPASHQPQQYAYQP